MGTLFGFVGGTQTLAAWGLIIMAIFSLGSAAISSFVTSRIMMATMHTSHQEVESLASSKEVLAETDEVIRVEEDGEWVKGLSFCKHMDAEIIQDFSDEEISTAFIKWSL